MKVEFIYSFQYAHLLGGDEASPELRESTLLQMKEFWDTYGTAIEQELLSLTGLSFTKKEMECYLNTKGSISNPLSVKIEDIENMKDNLIHELCGHNLFMQNYSTNKDFTEKWDAYWEKYKDEPPLTRSHILLSAMHLLLAQKLFPERVDAIRTYAKHPDYVRAWEIVEKEGAENIVKLIYP